MRISNLCRFIAASVLLFSLEGCLYTTHNVPVRLSANKLKSATLEELVQRLGSEAASVQTLNATINIATSVGGPKKGKATDYQEISGYVLVRRPSMLRMIGLAPVIRTHLFDMTSDGAAFKLSIPPQNRFVMGHSEVTKPSDKPLENLRPHIFMESLLLHEVQADEIPFLKVGEETVHDVKSKKDVQQADYELSIIRPKTGTHAKKEWFLSRVIIFSRIDLEPHQQLIYDENGNLATRATYDNFSTYNGVDFPSLILIGRPQEEYEFRLTIVKAVINGEIKDEQFDLKQPEGSQLQVLN